MNQGKLLLTLSILFFSAVAFCQDSIDFSSVDSLAASVQYKKNIYTLASELTEPYTNKLYKARSIFKWITENIRYDYKDYNRHYLKDKEPRMYKCNDKKDCEIQRIEWET